MSTSDFNLFVFWAKLPRPKEEFPPTKFHPVLCHMIDVAAVAEALWDEVLPSDVCARFAANLRLEVDSARAWTAFLAGLHDLGKICPKFQFVDAAEVLFKSEGAILNPYFRPIRCEAEAWHQWVTAVALPEILRKPRYSLEEDFAKRLAHILGGHHGDFPQTDELRTLKRKDALNENSTSNFVWNDCLGGGRWQVWRGAATDLLADVLQLPCGSAPRGGSKGEFIESNTFAMMLAGFVSVADWIGSNATHFKFEVTNIHNPPSVDAREYMSRAREKARLTLEYLGWRGSTKAHGEIITELDYGDLFAYLPPGGEPFTPNEMQHAVKTIADQITQPSLVILEAPMGKGKTEAAIYLAERQRTAGMSGGYYLALPTQATSNQMFSRVRRFLQHRFPNENINFQLLHGHASLAAELQVRRERKAKGEPATFKSHTVYDERKEGTEEPRIAAEEWFMNRKRGLLAPYGVGTVDQILLAALQTRHVFVRLYGLAGKTIIVDEVHAYDAYMTTLLERLLEWLAALRCSVVLLSATLPVAKRQSLVNAYRKGRGFEQAASLPPARYPRLTLTSGDDVHAETIYEPPANNSNDATDDNLNMLRIEWCDGALPETEDDPFALGDELQRRLAAGGCVAVVCNTVDRAQKMYLALQRRFARNTEIQKLPSPEVHLFHARYLFKDREQREKETLWRFGKQGDEVDFGDESEMKGKHKVERPQRAVLVATQVIEQSLDLDFDLMVSDFAPIDLLLQRSGRIWRHANNPRYGFTKPALWICRPMMRDGAPRFDAGTEAVYSPRSFHSSRDDNKDDNTPSYLLLRSWLTLNRGKWNADEAEAINISLARDMETLIENAYGEIDLPPDDCTERQREHWRYAKEQFENHRREYEDEAELRRLKEPKRRIALGEFAKHPRKEDAPEIHKAHQALTRLGDSVQVVCLYGTRARPSFDAKGEDKINPRREPTEDEAIRLLRHSLSLSTKRVVERLRAEPAPVGWRKSSLLRHYRLIALDEPPTGYRFILDDARGLLIEITGRKND